MSKRPPTRPANRKPVESAPVFQASAPATHGEADPQAEVVAGGNPQPQLSATASREEFSELLSTIKAQGHISTADEAAILREYDGMLAELRAEKTRLEAEYRERIAEDGQDQADAWLTGEAETLGRRQGEQLRRLVKTIPALAPTAAAQ